MHRNDLFTWRICAFKSFYSTHTTIAFVWNHIASEYTYSTERAFLISDSFILQIISWWMKIVTVFETENWAKN